MHSLHLHIFKRIDCRLTQQHRRVPVDYVNLDYCAFMFEKTVVANSWHAFAVSKGGLPNGSTGANTFSVITQP
jgi:hypothetical protein